MAEQEDFTTQLPEPAAPPPEPIQDDFGTEPEARPSVRDHIEKGFEDARTEQQPERKARADKGQPRKAAAKGYDRSARQEEPAPKIEQQQRGQIDPLARDSQAQEQVTAAPTAWNKDAQAEWNALPPTVQAAVAKRENDIARGVQQLRSRYSEIDEAVAPHLEAIRGNGFTPGQAVGQLFQWFKALHDNPVVAFPALAQSFGMDLNRLVAAAQQQYEQQYAQQQEQQQQNEQIPPYIRQALEQNQWLASRLSQHEQMLAQQNEARTHEVINSWSTGKPHFETVRHMMGQAIASGMVPLKDGRVDLDGAYSMACRAHPEVWQQLTAAQQAAHTNAVNQATQRQRQAEQNGANKARKAAVSIASSAPGLSNGLGKSGQVKKGMSVRESLMAAKEEVAANQ